MISAVAGLLTLLCALVTGLLIWTAYGVYSGQNMQIQAFAAKMMQLDMALSDYGSDAIPVRAQIRETLGKTIDQVWHADQSDCNFAADNFASALGTCGLVRRACGLHPTTDEQKQDLAEATSASDAIAQTRMQMSFALSAPVAYPVLLIVVGWVVCLFCGFGLTARATLTSVITLAVGSIAVASAVLLILDLSNPYSGIVLRFAGAVGAGAGGHGQGVTRKGNFIAPYPDSSPRSGRERP